MLLYFSGNVDDLIDDDVMDSENDLNFYRRVDNERPEQVESEEDDEPEKIVDD